MKYNIMGDLLKYRESLETSEQRAAFDEGIEDAMTGGARKRDHHKTTCERAAYSMALFNYKTHKVTE
jgi:hypothetical protein